MSQSALDSIVIVDDDPDARETYAFAVEDAALEPIRLQGPLGPLTDFAARPMLRTGALCDFELGAKNFAAFTGAELAAAWYKTHVPAVLCTRFEKAQLDRIRPFRRWIPRLLTPSDLNPDTLMSSLEVALQEFNGKFLQSRSPHRSLVRVIEIDPGDPRAFLFEMPGWSVETVLRYRLSDIPEPISSQIEPGFRTHVHSNLGTDAFEDLYFTDWGSA